MLVKILQPDFFYGDERGTLTQLVREGYTQINVIRSVKEAFRGGHYHKYSAEAFYIICGALELTLTKDGIAETHRFQTGDFFRIEPYVVHSFLFTEETLLVSMYDNGVERNDGSMDIFTN
jgi:quercetin dioxygenase-like cupin family protein